MNYDTAALVAAAQQVVADAKRLGLTWTLQNGTVTATSPTRVQMDGDNVSIQVTSMIGPVGVGVRVYIIQVPPAGNFIVGFVGNLNLTTANAMFIGGGPTQTSSSNVFVNILNPLGTNFGIDFPKKFNTTALRVDVQGTFYSITSASGPLFGIQVTGVTGNDSGAAGLAMSTHWVGFVAIANSTLNSHTPWSGSVLLPDLGSGTATVQLFWQRNQGTGGVRMDVNDALWMTVSEVWPA
jgi:hypothetical protein